MFRRLLIAAVVFLAVAVNATAVLPAAAKTSKAVGTHKLIVAVKKNMAPAAGTKLAVLVLLSQNGGPRAGGLATPSKPLTVLQENSGLYRVKAEIDSSCKGSCDASYRISGAANHKLEVVPSCQPKGSASSVARSRSSRSTNTGGSVGGHSRTLAQPAFQSYDLLASITESSLRLCSPLGRRETALRVLVSVPRIAPRERVSTDRLEGQATGGGPRGEVGPGGVRDRS